MRKLRHNLVKVTQQVSSKFRIQTRIQTECRQSPVPDCCDALPFFQALWNSGTKEGNSCNKALRLVSGPQEGLGKFKPLLFDNDTAM